MFLYMCLCVLMLLFSYMIIAIIALHLYFIHSLVFSLYFFIINNQNNNTALIYAEYQGFTEIVKLLLDKGADLNATDKVSHCMCVYVVLLIVVQSM